ncbi:MAG: hypothetical protein ACI841_003890, partial [Planctomycetota bacterium]
MMNTRIMMNHKLPQLGTLALALTSISGSTLAQGDNALLWENFDTPVPVTCMQPGSWGCSAPLPIGNDGWQLRDDR